MFLRSIKVSNFKSFEEIRVDFNRFNVLIGANASGKSNFVSIFNFLKDIANSGLDNAISMQGGIDYIRNINLGPSQDLSIELHIDLENEHGFPIEEKNKELTLFSPQEFFYNLCIRFPKKGKGYKIAGETLGIGIELAHVKGERDTEEEIETTKRGKIVFTNDGKEIKYEIDENIKEVLGKWAIPLPLVRRFLENGSSRKKLFLESEIPLFLVPTDSQFRDFIHNITLYDFDPRLSKLATQISGKAELEPDGRNLAIVLKNILENKKDAEKFFDITKSILPFIENITVEKLMDKSLIVSIKETYTKKKFPAILVSDGTISITALIIALYFEENPFVIFEEPERNIHPYLISKVIEMMKDVSETMKKQQIIITTHNPEVVKYADITHLLFMYRDENGFSRISRPVEKEEVKTFLENDIGIEELYVQNLLEW
jgi:predicted ATPase